ncbi:PIF1-like helicase [Hydrogenispora ethanolica]|uniref:PIF1-like helicase n=1 Tax=Hydrogenispora ethanolica TaxID=1082276 RepID=A0A4R1SAK8_HYDET|nr:AAA family ATPase [Hydrogenispora ethanolica]TCL76556.1 PIF1-like helicase [Hydrogenispora ethanolica]
MNLADRQSYISLPSFQAALDCIQSGTPITFISGKAGTGKSTFTKNELTKLKGNTVFLSPTGIAALNIGGQTIHSFFNLEHGPQYPERIKESRQAEIYRKIDTLVIDEISMVRADLMDAVHWALQANRKSEAAFGGVQLVLIGDLYQLPPVVRAEERREFSGGRYANRFFFNSRAIRAAILDQSFRYIQFSEVFRQADPRFISLLEQVRNCSLDRELIRVLNERVCAEARLEGIEDLTVLTCTNEAANRYNSDKLEELPGPKRLYEAAIDGKFSREDFPTLPILPLKVGAKVIFIKNDPGRVWVNGTTGIVKRLRDQEIIVRIDGEDHTVPKETWEKAQYRVSDGNIEKVVVGRFVQFPIKLGWALTIHKSQSLTLNNVYLDTGRGAFDSGQIYVALSRVRRLDNLFLKQPITDRDLLLDPSIHKFLDYIERLAWRNEAGTTQVSPKPAQDCGS